MKDNLSEELEFARWKRAYIIPENHFIKREILFWKNICVSRENIHVEKKKNNNNNNNEYDVLA